ncbi:MAG: hypothetical protein MMC23_010058 [Stictis urceolatum]|nr:hypothetical protein [Stictis urceolata]
MTSSLGRKVQGISREDQASLQGIGGLERLCRVYGSAEYLERKMRDWSDDVFFLELWDELQYRARNNVQDGRKVIKDMTVEAIAEITSSNVGSDAITGALFDETSSAYRRLRVRAEEVIIETISYSVREGLKLYCRINPWSSISPELGPMSITAEIETTIQQLSSYLSFLSKILADAPLRRVSRQVGHAIQDSVWNGVLMTHNFSTLGVAQLQRDMNAIWEMFDSLISDGFGRNSMRRLYEAIQLLSLPYISEGADELENSTSGLTSIQVVEERVYRDNESARDVLEELDMETLTESEARNVLDKRVELGL